MLLSPILFHYKLIWLIFTFALVKQISPKERPGSSTKYSTSKPTFTTKQSFALWHNNIADWIFVSFGNALRYHVHSWSMFHPQFYFFTRLWMYFLWEIDKFLLAMLVYQPGYIEYTTQGLLYQFFPLIVNTTTNKHLKLQIVKKHIWTK